jgi:hypothetical protein
MNSFQQMKQDLLKIILSKKIVHIDYSPHFDFNFFGHTSDTILNENLCPKKLKITNKNKMMAWLGSGRE